ncbi:MAG: hypoxanthine phosphoribosyltransferase [Phaeodactylibacter sp.]|nr:hypoxanthine phosphoribosyltransferase [Phaeodactylibacter sp.]MCB9275070.1 hypoxanthine phosphoribosyltransferase [Lewinellaceae bacterium]
MSTTITVHGLSFSPFLGAQDIQARILAMGAQISSDYEGKRPLFLAVLNGAFMFAADLLRACTVDCEIAFIRLASYDGLSSSGKVKTVIGLQEHLEGRHVIVVEDIVDSGKTLSEFLPQLREKGPASVSVAALLVKPEALEFEVPIHYKGFDIPSSFVVGYGLDYDGLGRNLPELYQLNQG